MYYQARRFPDGNYIFVNGKPLESDSCDWGRTGSHTDNTAYVILLDFFDDTDFAKEWYHNFSKHVIANLPHEWVLSSDDINRWYDQEVDIEVAN